MRLKLEMRCNVSDIMILCERHIVKKSHPLNVKIINIFVGDELK